jgi:hypothetical protein
MLAGKDWKDFQSCSVLFLLFSVKDDDLVEFRRISIIGGSGGKLNGQPPTSLPIMTTSAETEDIPPPPPPGNKRKAIVAQRPNSFIWTLKVQYKTEQLSQFRDPFKNCSSELFFCYFGRS